MYEKYHKHYLILQKWLKIKLLYLILFYLLFHKFVQNIKICDICYKSVEKKKKK